MFNILIVKRFRVRALLMCILINCSLQSFAQQDSLQAYRHFMQVCTGYQSAPLQLQVAYKVTTNLVLSPSDTASMRGYFYIGTNGKAYMQFGDVEQVIEDSIALTINHTTQQVFISRDIVKSSQLLRRYIGSITNDTSLQNLARAFNITNATATAEPSFSAYELYSYALIPATVLPKQMMRVIFNNHTNYPKEIITTRRTLLPIDPKDSVAFKTRFEGQGALVRLPNTALAFVREYTNNYQYLDINKQDAASIPLKVNDYVIKDEHGEFQLVAGKSSYRLTVQ